ncbi:progonadoliberin-2 isoform X1 [Sapajus apella]|uniref:Progonadoliberin-2 isoform X1 n=2 Tax=Sapajus apella TaxID=9515 RepID=A0A6J3JBD1_SAPAP|nr:progonadoliberin-2 isoform X1 [Sapajus apella]
MQPRKWEDETRTWASLEQESQAWRLMGRWWGGTICRWPEASSCLVNVCGVVWEGGWVVSCSPSPLKTSLESGGGAAWPINLGAIWLGSCSRLKEPSHPQLFLAWIELHPGCMPAMASSRRGLLLLLVLLTAHPGPSEAQHWSHGWYPGGKRALSSAQDPQNALRPPAGSPAQSAHGLSSDALAPLEDSIPWEGRTTAWWSLCQKQHLAQTLLTAAREPRPAPPSSNKV